MLAYTSDIGVPVVPTTLAEWIPYLIALILGAYQAYQKWFKRNQTPSPAPQPVIPAEMQLENGAEDPRAPLFARALFTGGTLSTIVQLIQLLRELPEFIEKAKPIIAEIKEVMAAIRKLLDSLKFQEQLLIEARSLAETRGCEHPQCPIVK